MEVVGESSMKVANYLKDNYFCIMPTSSVYSKKDKYISKEDEIKQVEEFLESNNITSLEIVVASSIRADICVNSLSNTRFKINHLFIDDGQFAQINRFTRAIMTHFLYLVIKVYIGLKVVL